MLSQGDLEHKYKLNSYQISYLLKAHELVNFNNKIVLEVGGSLPQKLVTNELLVSQWIGNEELSYYSESGYNSPSVIENSIVNSEYNSNVKYSTIAGGIEELNESYFGVFDIVFSIAAFEHINKFPEALEIIYLALKPGGKLITIFSPIWSSCVGHHLPQIIDSQEKEYDFGNSPLPPWGHLLMNRIELYDFLLSKFDKNFINKILYYVFNSSHINRYFLDDFIDLIHLSKFIKSDKNIIHPIFPIVVPKDIETVLKNKYGNRDFSNQGLFLLLEK